MKANDTQLKDEFLEQMYRSFQGIKSDKGAKSANLDGEFCLKYPISNNNIFKYPMAHELNVTEFSYIFEYSPEKQTYKSWKKMLYSVISIL